MATRSTTTPAWPAPGMSTTTVRGAGSVPTAGSGVGAPAGARQPPNCALASASACAGVTSPTRISVA